MNNVWTLPAGRQVLARTAIAETTSGVSSEPVNTEETGMTIAESDPNATVPMAPAQKPPGKSYLLFLVLMFVAMYFLLFRGPRKKQQQHKQMVQSLQKNDKVRTIGGIIGTVVDIKADEITLKVDESNNTKIKIATTAIGRNLSKD